MITPARLHGESGQAYAAFKAWIEMGDNRTIETAGKKIGKSKPLLGAWSARWKWQARLSNAQIEEHHQDKEAQAQAKLEAQRGVEARQALFVENSLAAAEEAMHIARRLLRNPIPAGESPSAAARLLTVADALGRMALGMPVTRSELTGKDGKPLASTVQPIINVTIHRDEATDRARARFGTPPPNRTRISSF